MKGKTLRLMEKNDYCVLSTVSSSGQPQSALVGFSNDSNFVLTIGTGNDTRKWRNIISNPKVSIVVTEGKVTVQYEGTAAPLEGEELKQRKAAHFAKLPGAKKYESDPSQAYLKIVPTWVRYTDTSQDPQLVGEMTL